MPASAVDRGLLARSRQQPRQQRQRPPTRSSTFAPSAATPSASSSSSSSNNNNITTSFPPYEIVSKTPDYDLRLYAPHFAVECDYSRRDEGYEKVGSYASGANESGTRFAPSQPVVMHFPPGTAAVAAAAAAGSPPSSSSEPKVMSLHVGPPLPSRKKKKSEEDASPSEGPSTPPLPTREGVRLAARGGELVAAARVPAQYATPGATLSAREALASALERDGLRLCERDSRGAFSWLSTGRCSSSRSA